MPPKKTASDNEGSADGSTGVTMSADEQQFLIDCLMCPVGGALVVGKRSYVIYFLKTAPRQDVSSQRPDLITEPL